MAAVEETLTPCHYCGIACDSVDHAVPQSLIDAVRASGDEALMAAVSDRRRRMTVPCCRECNHLAGAVYDETLDKRRHRIAERFERRHRRLLQIPDWSATELMELAEPMRLRVIASL